MTRDRWADKALVAPAVVLAVLVGVVALAPASAPPAAAATAQNLVQVGFNNLGGGGLNGEVTVVGNTALVATGINPAGGIHTHLYSPYKCEAGSVKVVNLSTPSNPTVVSTIQVPTGVSALDVAALRVDTPLFRGDLAAIAFATCGTGGGDVNRGVHYYDITNPASPVFLDYYDADADQRAPGTLPCGPARPGVSSPTGCASSQHSVSLVQRTDGRVLSLSTEPFASASNPAGCGPTAPRPPGPCPFPSGDLRIVDVTNPRDVVQVGSFPNGDDIPPGFGGTPSSPRRGFSNNGCRPFDASHSVGKTADGNRVLLPYFDLGMMTLNIADPTRPVKVGDASIYDRNSRSTEGNAAYGTAATVGGRQLALLSEEDWIAPNTTLRIDSPASSPQGLTAGSKFGCEAMYTLFDKENTAQIYRRAGSQLPSGGGSGDIVYLGRGCPVNVGFGTTTPDPYLTDSAGNPVDPRGKIAVMDRVATDKQYRTIPDPTNPSRQIVDPNSQVKNAGSGCSFADKTLRAQQNGAIGVVFDAQFFDSAFSPDGADVGFTIPVMALDRPAITQVRDTLCPSTDPPTSGRCTAGTPVRGAMVDSRGEWGALNIIDNTNPAAPLRLSTYRPPTARVFPPPDLGVYSVHHAVTSGNRAFVAANADGLRVLDLAIPAVPLEVASFVPDDRPDPTEQIPSKAMVTGVALAGPNIVITDVNSGLYVLAAQAAVPPPQEGTQPQPEPQPQAGAGAQAPPASASGARVAGVQAARASIRARSGQAAATSGRLPFTGTGVLILLTLGSGLVAAGSVLAATARRRRRPT